MAVGNSLAPKAQQKPEKVEFEVAGEKVVLTPQTVRDYLVSGDKERVTMQEIVMFINLCRYAGLNPWLKEAYCIKYGNEPATMVVGKEAFMKRAESAPGYDGIDYWRCDYIPERNTEASWGRDSWRLRRGIPERPFPSVSH